MAGMDRRAVAWAASGAMALAGRAGGPPLGCSGALVDLVEQAAATVGVDGLALLGERAAIAGLHRQGATSCGGGSRLLPAANGWMAVCLPRPDDVAAIPAWLGVTVGDGIDPWSVIAAALLECVADEAAARGALLGLPVATMGSTDPPPERAFDLPIVAVELADRPALRGVAGLQVLDLSALWAGPLCGALLARLGARVTKVESTTRPDGARLGPPAFYERLNAGKDEVVLDLSSDGGRRRLAELVAASDIVIEASRPRALEQLGIDAAAALAAPNGPRAWVSITGYGRGVSDRDRVAFGDVAAAAGGLVAGDADGPCFLADAVADPLTGLIAAAAVVRSIDVGAAWLLDVGMARVAAAAAGPPLDVGGLDAAPPRVGAW
jgi:hypothetical protein